MMPKRLEQQICLHVYKNNTIYIYMYIHIHIHVYLIIDLNRGVHALTMSTCAELMRIEAGAKNYDFFPWKHGGKHLPVAASIPVKQKFKRLQATL